MRRYSLIAFSIISIIVLYKLVFPDSTHKFHVSEYKYSGTFIKKEDDASFERKAFRAAIEKILTEENPDGLWDKITFSPDTPEERKAEFAGLPLQIAGLYSRNINLRDTELIRESVKMSVDAPYSQTPYMLNNPQRDVSDLSSDGHYETPTTISFEMDADIIPVENNPFGLTVVNQSSLIDRMKGIDFDYRLKKPGYVTILHNIDGYIKLLDSGYVLGGNRHFPPKNVKVRNYPHHYTPGDNYYFMVLVTPGPTKLSNMMHAEKNVTKVLSIYLEDVENEVRKQKNFSVGLIPYYYERDKHAASQ